MASSLTTQCDSAAPLRRSPASVQTKMRLRKVLTATALCTGVVLPAAGQEIEIDDTRDETVRTSTADDGTPADVSVTSDGAVEVDAGTAFIIDSDNLLSNAGSIRSEGEADGIGVLIDTGNDGISSGVTNSGRIEALADVDNDDVPMTGPNFGISLRGAGTFEGDITNDVSGRISAGGTGSIGLDLGAPITGSISNAGRIETDGEDSIGILLSGPLTGDLENSGEIRVDRRGGETGILVDAPIDGQIRNLGEIRSGTTSFLDDDFEIVDGSGGPALRVNSDVSGGILNGPVDPGDMADDSASLTARNAPAALLVSARRADGSGGNVDLGPVGMGEEAFAIVNRGTIEGRNDAQGLAATAVRIEGASVGGDTFRTTLAGGLLNESGATILADSSDGTATAISIGEFAELSEIRNAGRLESRSRVFQADTNFDGEADIVGEGADAFGIVIEEGANVGGISNSGTLSVQADGESSSAFGIVDRSGTVSSFDNGGQVLLTIDSGSDGRRIAADFSSATQDFTFTNPGQIVGDILLGAGNDFAGMNGGVLLGDLELGGGINRFELTGGALFAGTVRGEVVDLLVEDSTFRANAADPSFVRQATFAGASTLSVDIGADPSGAGALSVSDSLTLSSESILDPDFSVFPEIGDPIVLASADNLEIEGGLDALAVQVGLSSIVFEQELSLRTGVRDELVIALRRKSAEEIGLAGNNATVFEAIADGLTQDATLGPAIANIESAEQLDVALDQLRPQFSEVPRYLAVNSVNIAMGALRARLNSRRDMAERARNDSSFEGSPVADEFRIRPGQWSVFLQEIGSVADRDPTPGVRGYDGHSFGFLAGIDRSMLGFDTLGLSVMQSIADFNDDGFNEQDFETLTTQVNLYGNLTLGPVFFDFLGSFAYHDIEREHTVAFGDFSRRVDADWTAIQFGGAGNIGVQLDLGGLHARLAGTVNYVDLEEDDYAEEVGTNAVGFLVDERNSSSLRVGGTLDLSTTFDMGEETQLRPRLTGSYLTELDDDFVNTTARFGDAGERFNLSVPVTHDDTITGGLSFAVITRSVIVTAGYDAEIADDFFSHTGSLSVRLTF